MGKTVLILGNGFDLAHGLPTKYSDFLEFCKIFLTDIYDKDKTLTALLNKYGMNEKCIKYFSEKYDYFGNLLDKNIWYGYFSDDLLCKSLGRNWVDFESEIKLCIKYIDEKSKYLSKRVEDLFEKGNVIGDENNALIRYSAFKSAVLNSIKKDKDVFDLRTLLYEDLKGLIQAIEIYLLLVEKMPIKLISKDISGFYYDYIINFNYTHTYNLNKHYNNLKVDVDEPTEIFYIHGETGKKTNNMVLGIDEYWSKYERDNHTNFTIFKKFAQRIQKKTGVDSYKWIKEINDLYKKNIAKNSNRNSAVAEVHIFGHSLDVTDKDILYDYLESEATDVTIYCKDEATEGEYIANVIKIITEDRLLEKVNQYPPKLKFVIQQPMVSIEEEEKEPLTSGTAL